MKGKYLLPQEAAKYLGISLSTLYRVEQRGDIKPIRTPGGHRRYAVDMLDGYLVDAASFKPRRRAVAKTQVTAAAVNVAAAPVIETSATEEPIAEPLVAEVVEDATEQTWATEQVAPSPVSAHAIDLSAAQPAPLFKPSAHVLDLRGGQA